MVDYNRLRPRAILSQVQNYAPGTFNPAIEGGSKFASGQRKVFKSDAAQQGLRTTMTRASQGDKRSMRFANLTNFVPDDSIIPPPTVLFKNADGKYQYAQVKGVNRLNQTVFDDPNTASPERRKEIMAARAAFNQGEGGNEQYFPKTLLGGYAPRKGETRTSTQAGIIPLDQPFRKGSGYPAVGGNALQMQYEMIGDPIPENRLPVRALEQIARRQGITDYYNEGADTGFFKDNTVTFAPYQTYQQSLRGQSTPIPKSLQDGQYPESILAKLGYIRGDDGIPIKIQGTKEELDTGLGYLFVDGKEVPLSRYNEQANSRFNIFRNVPLDQNRTLSALYPNQPSVIDMPPRRADMQGVEKELRDINYLIKDHGRELASTYYGNQYTEPGLTEIEANIRNRMNPIRFEADLNRRVAYANPKEQYRDAANRRQLTISSPTSRVPLPSLYDAPEIVPKQGNTIADYDVIQPTYLNTNTNADDIDLFNRFTRMSSEAQSMTTSDDIEYGRRYVPSEIELLNRNFGYDPRGFIAYRPNQTQQITPSPRPENYRERQVQSRAYVNNLNQTDDLVPSIGDFYTNAPQALGYRIPIPQPNNPEANYKLASVNEFGMPLYSDNSYVPPSGYENTLIPPAFVRRTQVAPGQTVEGRWIGGGLSPTLRKYGKSKLDMRNDVSIDPLTSDYQINIPKGGRYIQVLENEDPRAINARVQDLRARQEAALLPPDVTFAPFIRQYKITQTGGYTNPAGDDIVIEGATIPVMKEVSKDVYEPVQLPFITNAKTLAQDLADVRVMVGNRSFPLTPEATTEPYVLSEEQRSKRFVESQRRRRMGLEDDYYQLQGPSDAELEIIESQMSRGGVRGMAANINPDDDLAALARAARSQDNREIYADPNIEPTDALEAIQALRRRERELNAAISRYQEPEYFNRNETALASRYGGGTRSTPQQYAASPSINRFINEEEAAAIAAKANIRPQKMTRVQNDDGTFYDSPTDYIGYVSPDDILADALDGTDAIGQRLSREQLVAKRNQIQQQANQAQATYNQLMNLERQPIIDIDAYPSNLREAQVLRDNLKDEGFLVQLTEDLADNYYRVTGRGSFRYPEGDEEYAPINLPTTRNRLPVEVDPEIAALYRQDQYDQAERRAMANTLAGQLKDIKAAVGRQRLEADGLMPIPLLTPEESAMMRNQMMQQGNMPKPKEINALTVREQSIYPNKIIYENQQQLNQKEPTAIKAQIFEKEVPRTSPKELSNKNIFENQYATTLGGSDSINFRNKLFNVDLGQNNTSGISIGKDLIASNIITPEQYYLLPGNQNSMSKLNVPQQMQNAQDIAEAQMRMVQDSGRIQGRIRRWTQEIPESVAAKQAEQAANLVAAEDVWSANRLRGQSQRLPTQVSPTGSTVRLTPVDSSVYEQMIAVDNMNPSLGSQALSRQFQDSAKTPNDFTITNRGFDIAREILPTRYPTMEDSIRRNNEQQPYGIYRQIQGPRYQQYDPTGITEQVQESPETMSMLQRYAVPLGLGGTLLGAAALNSYAQQQEQARMREEAELARMYGFYN